MNLINGFQLRIWSGTTRPTSPEGLLGCRDPVAMATRRQAPKLSQKKRGGKKKKKKDGCHGVLIIEDGAEGEHRAWLPVGCWVTDPASSRLSEPVCIQLHCSSSVKYILQTWNIEPPYLNVQLFREPLEFLQIL